MNATQNIPVSDIGHPLSYETDRKLANQARSEFLGEGLAYIGQSIRFALKKSIGVLHNISNSFFKQA